MQIYIYKPGVLAVNLLLHNKKMFCENSSTQCILNILLSSRIAGITGDESKTTIIGPWERNYGNFSGYRRKVNIYYLLSQVFLSFSLIPEKKFYPRYVPLGCNFQLILNFQWHICTDSSEDSWFWCILFNYALLFWLSCSVYHPEEYSWRYRPM